jgi:hypothetical protein
MLMVVHKILELKMKVVEIGESSSGESKQNLKRRKKLNISVNDAWKKLEKVVKNDN